LRLRTSTGQRSRILPEVSNMPGPHFFSNLGLFVRNDFLDAAMCARVIAAMRAADTDKALISGDDPEQPVLNESRRKVLFSIHLDKSIRALINDKLAAMKPSFAAHFGIPLGEMEKPGFLKYGEGSFYKTHKDTSIVNPPNVPTRRVSVVTFLNAAAI